MMRVFVEPTGLHSRAMKRVAAALTRYAPPEVEIVARPEVADLLVLHVISFDAMEFGRKARAGGQRYAPIQYCLASTECTEPWHWYPFWRNAAAVWSYYDLAEHAEREGFRFWRAPLGLDDEFRRPAPLAQRDRLVVTSGYVAGPRAEAIEEVWRAAGIASVRAIHVGPGQIEGMLTAPIGWRACQDLDDRRLADIYRRATWVSGLRHAEGFELPAAEGLACGARAILFDQPSQRHWYGHLAEYLPDVAGDALVERLVKIFEAPRPVSDRERGEALERFDWEPICCGFWELIKEESKSCT